MSSTSSVVSADMRSDSTLPATFAPSLSANSTRSARSSCVTSSLVCPSTATFAPFVQSVARQTCSLADHPASAPVSGQLSLAIEPVKLSGPKCSVSPTSWHANGLSWSSPPVMRRGKPRSHVIWQELATSAPELSSRLQILVRLIFEGACSFLPTPVCRDWRSPGLRSHPRLNGSRGQPLPETIGSRVHPELCEWLMGFPIGWTAMLPSKRSAIATRQEWRLSSAEQS